MDETTTVVGGAAVVVAVDNVRVVLVPVDLGTVVTSLTDGMAGLLESEVAIVVSEATFGAGHVGGRSPSP